MCKGTQIRFIVDRALYAMHTVLKYYKEISHKNSTVFVLKSVLNKCLKNCIILIESRQIKTKTFTTLFKHFKILNQNL